MKLNRMQSDRDVISDNYRKTLHEYRYFSSDLSKYIHQKLPNNFTSMNLDIVQFKHEKKLIRFIEYKHTNEWENHGQRQLMYKLSRIDKIDGCDVEVVYIHGNYPFDTAMVTNKKTGEIKYICNSELLKFLSMDIRFEELAIIKPKQL
jgi:hypothetical protein